MALSGAVAIGIAIGKFIIGTKTKDSSQKVTIATKDAKISDLEQEIQDKNDALEKILNNVTLDDKLEKLLENDPEFDTLLGKKKVQELFHSVLKKREEKYNGKNL